ncbi:MAG: hypothetical protein GWO24_19135 [Akkermansiaceae bacterium]|nr:hypothetical protein [Akkermansiaceae bacterium]
MISGDLADFEGDGISTLLEYALVSSPREFDPEHLPSLVRVEDGGNEFLALRYRRRPGAIDLTYEIESSLNLVDWVTAAGLVLSGSVNNGDGSVTETRRLPVALEGAPEVFLRLRVSIR